jgi:hypothetical protein
VPETAAQVYYLYPGAPVVEETEPAIGTVFGIGDNLIRLLGYGRFNVNDIVDLGLELVLDRYEVGDDTWRVGLAGDIKYTIIPQNTQLPFDLAVNTGLGFEGGGNLTNVDIPLGGVISRPLRLASGRILIPYGGLYLVVSHVSYDLPSTPGQPSRDSDDTDVDVQLRAGIRIVIDRTSSVFTTLHIGDDTMLALGINLSL